MNPGLHLALHRGDEIGFGAGFVERFARLCHFHLLKAVGDQNRHSTTPFNSLLILLNLRRRHTVTES